MYVPGNDNTIYFSPNGLTFALTSAPPATALPVFGAVAGNAARLPHAAIEPATRQRWAVKLDFVGANPKIQPVGQNASAATFSYFRGQQSQWQVGVPTYAQVRYPELWPGIDLVYSGQANQLKYEFVVQPGANPAQIQLAYRGATAVRLTADGQLEVVTPLNTFRDAAPVAYQVRAGQRVPVEMSYALDAGPSSGEPARYGFGFHLGAYDPALPLVLDPAVWIYTGYIGGAGVDTQATASRWTLRGLPM